MQAMTIQNGAVTRLPIGQTADLRTWEDVTANAADLSLPVGVVPRIAKDSRRLTAVQLFE